MAAQHHIRLRGGWQCEPPGEAPVPAGWVTLPAVWPLEMHEPFRLIRRFGRPATDPATERVFLRLEDVPGLERVSLNGQVLELPMHQEPGCELDVSGLLHERNELVLDVDPAAWGTRAAPRLWGVLALVIRVVD